MSAIRITRAGPLCTVQDAGRFGMLRHGISASGPMDRGAFERAGDWMGGAGAAGIEFTTAGFGFVVEDGSVGAGFDGGAFTLSVNGAGRGWPERIVLKDGDAVELTPGPAGNYGYVRFDRELELPRVMGSLATNAVVGLGGLEGRALHPGDRITFGAAVATRGAGGHPRPTPVADGPIRVVWGLHADLFDPATRERFLSAAFHISSRIDRMGARLQTTAPFAMREQTTSLVSDAIVPGDIQILGDGTPIVLLRDHQPTGGYPRIATVISADLDRFVQLRPGATVRFEAVSLEKAHAAMAGRR